MSRTYLVLLVWGMGASSAVAQAPVTTVWFGAPGSTAPARVAHDERPTPSGASPQRETSGASPGDLPSAPNLAGSAPTPSGVSPDPPVPAACPGPVHLVRHMGGPAEQLRIPLLDCRGRPVLEARRQLAILMRPRQDRAAPAAEALEAWERADGDPDFLTARVRLPHPALLSRIQMLSDTLNGARLEILSGHRPQSPGSRHAHGRALDLRAADPDALHAAARGLPESGVGWHETGRFLHLDVRPTASYWESDQTEGTPRIHSERRPARSRVEPSPAPETATAAPPEGNAAGASSADVNAALSEIQRAMHVIVPPPPQ